MKYRKIYIFVAQLC